MKLTRLLALTAPLVFAVGLGCNTVNTVEPANPTANIDPLLIKKVTTDPGLNDAARVMAVRKGTVSGDILRVDVEVLNTRFTQERFSYLFEWFDESGLQVYTPLTRWTPQVIEAKETITVIGIAPNPRAKDFRLKIEKSKL